ncbi:hypothetical protein QSE00_23065 [Arenibacter sp. M-2]|uniref:hypothetical protein n=1 Tax=Arenibacter sp. M-2 TaxID=3053612 RepID=UPI00256FD1EB|nr:hypothetical protein [Arenibacter sp. M-2]MDL5514710.1 hypothetical protein [Arenibacter sp. M-2]
MNNYFLLSQFFDSVPKVLKRYSKAGSIFILCMFANWATSQELYIDANAASITNEANSTTGWTGAAIMTADTADPHHGSYALKIATLDDRGDQEGRRASYSFTAIIGDVYNITFWAKPGTANTSSPAFAGWSGFSGASTVVITDQNWTQYNFTVTASSTTPIIRVYAGTSFSSGGSTSDYVLVDRISIENQNSPVATNIFPDNGNVGIGTTDPGIWKLAVNGNIRAKEIKVETANWPDYVFAKDYELPSLEEVEKHINDKGHLINIPTALDVKSNGIELGEMNKLLLEKIEELTLYLIDMKKEIIELKAKHKE